MKKSMKFATALAGAAVVVLGGTAFTDNNTVPASKAGHGAGAVTGVVMTKTAYEVSETNTVAKVIFTTATTTAGQGLQASLYTTASGLDPAEISAADQCAQTGSGPYTITCTMPGDTAVEDVKSTGLTVWDEIS